MGRVGDGRNGMMVGMSHTMVLFVCKSGNGPKGWKNGPKGWKNGPKGW